MFHLSIHTVFTASLGLKNQVKLKHRSFRKSFFKPLFDGIEWLEVSLRTWKRRVGNMRAWDCNDSLASHYRLYRSKSGRYYQFLSDAIDLRFSNEPFWQRNAWKFSPGGSQWPSISPLPESSPIAFCSAPVLNRGASGCSSIVRNGATLLFGRSCVPPAIQKLEKLFWRSSCRTTGSFLLHFCPRLLYK